MKNKVLKALTLLLALVIVLSVAFCAVGTVSAASKSTKYKKYINYRGQDLRNTYAKLISGKELNVVYFGGSVTNGTGVSNAETDSWRGLIGQWLIDNFPNATINNMNKAIGATGSKLGAYRLNHDVIAFKPDLVFVEFAINDHYDDQGEAVTLAEYSMRFESIIRNIRKELPKCDIVTIFTTEIFYVNTNQAGELHPHAKEHENICIAYDVPSIHVGRALADKITVGKAKEEWPKYFIDDVHPNREGYKIYYDVIKEYFNNCLFFGGYDGTSKKHTLPKMVNNYLLDGNIKVIDVDKALVAKSQEMGGKNFKLKYHTDMNIGNPFKPFGDDGAAPEDYDKMMSFVLEFTGTEIAILEYCENIDYFSVKVDGGKEKSVSHAMEPTVLASGLKYGKHTITIRPSFGDDNGKKAFWIKAFFVRDERARTAKYDHEHRFYKYVSDKNATCKKDGTKTSKCYKSGCDMTKTIADKGTKLAHKYVTVATKKATLSKNGKGEKVCKYCDRFDDTVTIKKVKSVKLSTTSYTYNGKAKKPSVTVKDSSGKKLKKDTDYTVKYASGRKKVGKYKVTVTFKGKYKGTKKLYFTIKPPKTSVKKVTAAKKSLKVKITKKSSQVKGYEIQYSTSKKFKSAKTKTVKSYKTTSVTLKKLKAKKTYYVRVRTYKTVGKTKYYSSWSKYTKKKTK